MPTAAPAAGARTFRAFGTFATLLVTHPDRLEPAHDLLAAELDAMDAACSRFRPGLEPCRAPPHPGLSGPGQRAVQAEALSAWPSRPPP